MLLLPKRRDPSPDESTSYFVRFSLRLEQQIKRANDLTVRTYEAANIRTNGLLPHLLTGWTHFVQRDTQFAASLSYFAIFSLFPAVLLIVTFISRLIGPALAQEHILRILNLLIPAEVISPVEDTVRFALQQSHSFGLLVLVGLGWSALSLFSNLTIALDTIFHPAYWRPLWHKRLLALLMYAVLGIILLGSLVTSITIRLMSIFTLSQSGVTLNLILQFLPLGLNMTIFALLFRYAPRVHVHWEAIWPAALAGGGGWLIAQNVFVWYLRNFSALNQIYGSLATAIVLLLYVYISAAILLLAAELCAAINIWIDTRHSPPQP